MLHDALSYRSLRALAPVTVALAAIIAACASNSPGAGAPALAPQASAASRQKEPGVYRADQVTKPVAQERGNMPPHYPDVLKTAGIGGVVLLAFVVDTAGRVDVGSATVVQTSDDRFVPPVVAALPFLRFTSAEFQGRKVKQLVAQPYYFGIVDTTRAHGAQTIEQAVRTLTGSALVPIRP